MTDSDLHKYINRGQASSSSPSRPNAEEIESADDIQNSDASFGCIRGNSRERAITLELRKKTGNIKAIPYSCIEGMDYDPSEGIVLHVHGRSIRIKGRNLNGGESAEARLFSSLCRQRVSWVRETDCHKQLAAARDELVVESLAWDH